MNPTIKRGSTGQYVKQWQDIIGVKADGAFGPATEAVTKNWQKKNDLAADGIVGPITWAKALGLREPARPRPNIHTEARDVIDRALPELSEREKLALQGVALLETTYGRGWHPPGNGSNNMGAITGTYKGKGFTYSDSRYDEATGTVIPYETTFRAYPTPEEGMRDLAKVMYDERPSVRAAAKRGDLEGVSRALRESSYYIGTKPKEQAIASHHKAMEDRIATILNATGMSNAFRWFSPLLSGAVGVLAALGTIGAVILFHRNR